MLFFYALVKKNKPIIKLDFINPSVIITIPYKKINTIRKALMKLKFFSVLLLTICLFQAVLFSAESEESKRSSAETQEWLKQTKDIRPCARMKSGAALCSRKKRRRSSSLESSVLVLSTLFFSMNCSSGENKVMGNRKERRAHLQKNVAESSLS